jgi:hypothetical protein
MAPTTAMASQAVPALRTSSRSSSTPRQARLAVIMTLRRSSRSAIVPAYGSTSAVIPVSAAST